MSFWDLGIEFIISKTLSSNALLVRKKPLGSQVKYISLVTRLKFNIKVFQVAQQEHKQR